MSEDCKTPGELKGGTILGIAVTIEKTQYLDLEKLAATAFALCFRRNAPVNPHPR